MLSCNLYHNDFYWDQAWELYTPRTLCVPVMCNRLQIMQSGSMELLTTINIVLGAFGGNWPLFFGGGSPPPKWPVCNTARTYTGWIYTKAILSEKCCNPFHQCLEGAAWNQIFKGWYDAHCSPIATCSKYLVQKVNGWSCRQTVVLREWPTNTNVWDSAAALTVPIWDRASLRLW